jgi:hypothetical protein
MFFRRPNDRTGHRQVERLYEIVACRITEDAVAECNLLFPLGHDTNHGCVNQRHASGLTAIEAVDGEARDRCRHYVVGRVPGKDGFEFLHGSVSDYFRAKVDSQTLSGSGNVSAQSFYRLSYLVTYLLGRRS